MRFNQQTDQASPRLFGKSALGLFIALICMLFAAGCSGGGGGNGGFVASPTGSSGTSGGGVGNGSVTFNFVKAQSAIVVPTTTVNLRFQFFTGLEGTGVVVLNETRPFAAQVTFDSVPSSVRSVKITALTQEGYPVSEFKASFDVSINQNVVVSATGGTTTPVTLDTVVARPSSLSLAIGGTSTPTIELNFSNGELVRLTAAQVPTEITFGSSDSAVASVTAAGLITGLVNGTATITADVNDYAGKSVSIVTQVGNGIVLPPLVTSLTITNAPSIMPVGTTAGPLVVTATFDNNTTAVKTIADGVTFSSSDANFSVDNSQNVVLAANAPTNATATITASFMGASKTFKVNASTATLTSITLSPTSVNLPFGGFEQNVTAVGNFSDGSTVNVSAAQLSFVESPTSDRYDVVGTKVVTATTDPGGAANPQQLQVTANINGNTSTATMNVTVGAITVDSLTVTPSPVVLKPGQVQPFVVVANLSNATTVDVSDFTGLMIVAASAPSSMDVDIVANGKQVVAVSPTPDPVPPATLGEPATVTFTFAGQSAVVNVNVLREFLTSVEYRFAGNTIQNQTVNLPRGYVGVFEVIGTFNTGTVRRLNFNEYHIDVPPAPTTDPFDMIKPFTDGYNIPQVRNRYFDGQMSDFNGDGPCSADGPANQNFDAAGNYVAQTDEAVADDLYAGAARTVTSLTTTPAQIGSDFSTVTTRDTFRAVAADWPRGESNNGDFLSKNAAADPDSVVNSGNRLIAPGANRTVNLVLESNVTDPANPTALNQTVSVTVTDPRAVTFVSAQFVNYPTENQTPIGSVREYEVRVTFAAVTSGDTVDQDEPAVGPFVAAQQNFKLAEANCHIISNLGGQNQFSVNTPTSLGFVGVFSNVTVDVNALNIIVTPLAGVGVRPVANTLPERRPDTGGGLLDIYNAATYTTHDRVFGPSFELILQEDPKRSTIYDPGPALPDSNSQATRDPADKYVYNSIEKNDAPIKFVNPLLFSLDPINGTGNDPLGIVLGASQVFRTMVQFTANQAPVERTLDYVPTLVVSGTPALAGFGDAATGRLSVSAINAAGTDVSAADATTTTGYAALATNAEVTGSIMAGVKGIVIALDSVGEPIAKKGTWVTAVPDSLSQTGAAQAVTRVSVAP